MNEHVWYIWFVLAIVGLFGLILVQRVELRRCRRSLRRHLIPTGIVIYQSRLRSKDQMSILGIAPGATGQFNEVPLPPGSVFPAGTVFAWATDDTVNAPVVPSADGVTAAVSVPTTIQNSATSFNLRVTATFIPPGGSQTTLQKTVNVPFNIPVPTDMDINQVS